MLTINGVLSIKLSEVVQCEPTERHECLSFRLITIETPHGDIVLTVENEGSASYPKIPVEFV